PQAGERVALLFEHDAAMIVGILGALRAGKTYVPIDPLYPRERSAYVLEDSGAAVLLTNAANLETARELAGGGVPVVDVDAPGADGADAALPEVRPDDPAYILYTSGSTGRPKGVVQSHRNVLHFIRVYSNNLRIGPDDRLTLFSSYTFDAAVMATYGALLNGAALLPFDWREEAAASVARWMRRERITLYHSTPTVFRHLVGGLGEGEAFPAVRVVVLGGEEAQRRDWEAFRRHFPPGAVLVNGLGPTESTLALQAYLDRGTGPRGATLPVGLPVRDTDVLLMNAAGEQPAVYGAGEIVVRGPHLALGYWGRPELTAAAFGPDPAGGPERAYRTGDLGRRLPDGDLEFLGRRDFQVKVRGVRVEPGEAEAALRAHPAVREAVVAPRGDAAGGRRRVAWLVPERPGGLPPAAELRGWARERLPEHAVPAAFVAVDALPLTSTGKTDRLALPDPGPGEARGYTAPRGMTEELLAGIWAEVLKLERVGVHDDFFDLGGHSLLATQVVARIRAALGAEVPLRALFEAPTVAELAERVLAAAPAARVDDRELDEEMEKLASLSDEEVLRLLREMEG
ncbi:MAG TPA: non-ribosomal peptide synthetase, partial [Longimicrobiaceae bacterium]